MLAACLRQGSGCLGTILFASPSGGVIGKARLSSRPPWRKSLTVTLHEPNQYKSSSYHTSAVELDLPGIYPKLVPSTRYYSRQLEPHRTLQTANHSRSRTKYTYDPRFELRYFGSRLYGLSMGGAQEVAILNMGGTIYRVLIIRTAMVLPSLSCIPKVW